MVVFGSTTIIALPAASAALGAAGALIKDVKLAYNMISKRLRGDKIMHTPLSIA
ncbi:MAG: hypothetical protein LBB16_00085 [Puniceicoccales bacterium]|jgi:hypothetical protein|nr:hypothetical protein [Puniceicoccales bacterium]